MLFSISNETFPKIQGQLIAMTRFISGVVTPKDKTDSNPLAILKVRIFSKDVVSLESYFWKQLFLKRTYQSLGVIFFNLALLCSFVFSKTHIVYMMFIVISSPFSVCILLAQMNGCFYFLFFFFLRLYTGFHSSLWA